MHYAYHQVDTHSAFISASSIVLFFNSHSQQVQSGREAIIASEGVPALTEALQTSPEAAAGTFRVSGLSESSSACKVVMMTHQ
jgi:hypothetical protein